MLSNSQLLDQLSLQNQLNSAVDPNWLHANHSWTRAIMMEAAEALDLLGWKWWKAPEPFLESQFRLELVDIWHFILTNELTVCDGDAHEATANLRGALRDPQYLISRSGQTVDLRHVDVYDLLHVMIGAAAFGEVHLTAFALLMDYMKMSWDNLHQAYIAKNVLNLFRQAHGYKEGGYFKQWGSREDNEVLSEMVELSPQLSPEELMARLRAVYVQFNPMESV